MTRADTTLSMYTLVFGMKAVEDHTSPILLENFWKPSNILWAWNLMSALLWGLVSISVSLSSPRRPYRESLIWRNSVASLKENVSLLVGCRNSDCNFAMTIEKVTTINVEYICVILWLWLPHKCSPDFKCTY